LPVINTKQHIVCFFVFWVIKRQLLSCTLKIQTKNNMFCELRLRWPDTNFKCILKLIYILEHTVFLRNGKRHRYTMQFVLQFCCDTRSTSHIFEWLNDLLNFSKWQVHGMASDLRNLKLQIGKSSHTIYKLKGYKS
jgi:hypothetical protein